MRNKFLSVLAAVLCVLSIAGMAFAGSKIPKNMLVIGTGTEIVITFDPGVSYEVLTNTIVKNLYSSLLKVTVKDGKFVAIPEVAESWKVAEDGKTWTFNLRKGMKFANGDPLKSDSVVYSLKRVLQLNQSPAWIFKDVLGVSVEGITAPDDYTVTIVTNGAPSNVVLTNLGDSVGAVLNMKEVQAHEKDGDMGQAWLIDHSAGAGPYVLKSWKRNTSIVLVANKTYWRGEPALKKVYYKDAPEATDQLLLLKKGDIDVAWTLLPEQAKSLEGNPDVAVIKTPAQTMEYVGMNANWGPLKDVRVRQAIKYAIDYDAMINDVRGGFAIKNQQFLPLGYFGYVESNPFEQNIEKAKKLLAEAGYPDGFEVELTTNVRETRRNEAVVVQENLSKIGIKAKLNILQASQMYGKYRKQGLQMIVAGWGIDYPDPDALANPFANHRVKQLAWRNAWMDDHAADLAEAAGKEMNEKKRFELYSELTEYWQNNGPFAMLLQPMQYWGVRKDVKGWDKATAGYSVNFDLTQAYK